MRKISKLHVKDLIKKFPDLAFFTGGVEDEIILNIERELETPLPESYRWFLSTFGFGGVGGSQIEGVGKDKTFTVVTVTKKLSNYGLPDGLIVIEDCDEYVACLDLRSGDQEDCRVVTWSNYDKSGILHKTDSFYDYLLYSFFNEDDMNDDELYQQWLRIFNKMKKE